jgi:hypothetical protein
MPFRNFRAFRGSSTWREARTAILSASAQDSFFSGE